MPRSVGEQLIREVPLLREDEPLRTSVERILQAEVPALPVVDAGGKLVGIFGEREFIGALFPGYLGELRYAGFVRGRIEETLQKRATCLGEAVSKYMNTEHIDVGDDWSDAQIAETFLHHRVLIVPVLRGGRIEGVITRWDFFKAMFERAREAP